MAVDAEVDDAAPTQPQVDVLRLLTLVELRRGLRLVWRLAFAGVIVWAAATFLLEEVVLDRTTSFFWQLDAVIGPVFVVLLSIMAGALVAQVAVRFGRAGRVAAALVPAFARGGEPVVRGEQHLHGLLPLLRRKALLSSGGLFAVVVLLGCTAAAGWNVVPAYRGNHGRGGPVVTIGDDATVTGYEVSSRGHRNYYLDTPYGRTLAEDHHPRTGQRWTVFEHDTGNNVAYLVGGHDYVLIAVVTVMLAVITLGAAGYLTIGAGAERRRRRAAGAPSLAGALAAFGQGRHATLQVGRAPAVRLGFRPLEPGAAERIVRRRRLRGLTAAGLAAAVAVVAGALWQGGAFESPPTERAVHLPWLAGSGWSDGTAFYTVDTNAREVLHAYLDPAAPGGTAPITGQWWFDTTFGPAGTDADVQVALTDPVSPAAVRRSTLAELQTFARIDHAGTTPLAGLAAGCEGLLEKGTDETSTHVVCSDGRRTLLIEASTYGRADDPTPAALSAAVARLTTAIAGRGLAGVVHDTAQP
ncbi:MAG: hypothetical protein ACTHMS_08490 [Jatrophihabitans sp.]|uniref:hypothetical protein n=1 Tax=Jatrophihabitans sp. TaxID=1932789 RepID=UPI003F7E6953